MESWQSALVKFGGWLVAAIGGAKLLDVGLGIYRDKQLKSTITLHLYEELSSNYEAVISKLTILGSLEAIKHGTAFRFRKNLGVRFQMENQHLELHKEQYWTLPEIHAIDRIYKADSQGG